MSIAFLFPGQGSQTPGMLHRLPDHPAALRTIEEISAELERDVRTLDSPEALRSTVSVQLALLTAGVAAARTLEEEGVIPEAVAGLSVGAFAAAVRWYDATTVLQELGCDLFLEMPPGHVLTNLAKQSFADVRCIALAETSLSYIVRQAVRHSSDERL